jgi:hypothetical protein
VNKIHLETADKVLPDVVIQQQIFLLFLRILNKNAGNKLYLERFVKDIANQI